MAQAKKIGTRKAGDRSEAVIGYIRVSTDQQAESGAGMAAQRSSIRRQCEQHGWELAAIYEDNGASAKTLKGRPGLSEALVVLANGDAAALVVAKLDRLARSVHDFAGLVRIAERERWGIVALDLGVDMTTPTGGLLANVTASVAEWERRIISQRTSEALAQRRAAGVRLGRPRSLDPAIADRIHRRRTKGATLQAIADELNAGSISTPTGRVWSPALVRKIALQVPRSSVVTAAKS
jgi:DNA invertase Pin-like site-specific DNA recombinase